MCVCVCVCVYVGSSPHFRTSSNTSSQPLPKHSLHCFVCFLKSRDVTLCWRSNTRQWHCYSNAIDCNRKWKATKLNYFSRHKCRISVIIGSAQGTRGRVEWQASLRSDGQQQPFCSQVLSSSVENPAGGREGSIVETLRLTFGRSLVKCAHCCRTNSRQQKLRGFDEMAGRTADANGWQSLIRAQNVILTL